MNKSIIFTIHLALLFLLNGCQFENTEPADPLFTGSKTEDPSVSNSKVLIDPELYSDLKTFDYRIDSAWIVTDSLKLIVSYTGCEPGVPNRLLFDGSFMESYPVQARLKFVLDDPGDCDGHCRRVLFRPGATAGKLSQKLSGAICYNHYTSGRI
jgi:hypothetical protein